MTGDAVRAPAEQRQALYRDLYFAERNRREVIRGSLGTPIAALAFAVYSLAAIAANVEIDAWWHPTVLAINVLIVGTLIFLFAGAVFAIRVEWLLVYHEPSDLTEMLKSEKLLNERLGGHEADPNEVAQQFSDLLTANFHLCYHRYMSINERSAHNRTLALRYTVAAILCEAVAMAVIVLQK